MSKSVAQLPVVPFSYEEVMSGALPSLFARMAVEHGPILKHVVQSGPYAGEAFVYMVGPDANRFVWLSRSTCGPPACAIVSRL